MLIARLHHFIFCRKTQPELIATEFSLGLFWHLTVQYALACSHPLDASVFEETTATPGIPVPKAAALHICYRFNSPVGMGRKPGNIIVGVAAPYFIKQDKGVDIIQPVRTNDPVYPYACSVCNHLSLVDVFNSAWLIFHCCRLKIHCLSPFRVPTFCIIYPTAPAPKVSAHSFQR